MTRREFREKLQDRGCFSLRSIIGAAGCVCGMLAVFLPQVDTAAGITVFTGSTVLLGTTTVDSLTNKKGGAK